MAVADSQKLTAYIVTKGTVVDGGTGVRPCLNTFAFRRPSGAPTLNKNNVLTAFDNHLKVVTQDALHEDYTCTEVVCRMLEDNLDAFTSKTVAWAGVKTTDRAPDMVCVTYQLRTSVRGRNYRGSKHYSPIAEADTDKDVIAAASLGDFNALGAKLLAGFTDSDGNAWAPVVYSPSLSTLAGDLWTIAAFAIDSVLLNSAIGTCNSRKSS